MLRLAGKVLAGTALAYGLVVVVVSLAELLRAVLDEVDWDQDDEPEDLPAKVYPDPLWEAMDCPDVTDDPFYD